MQHGAIPVVAEADVVELDAAGNIGQREGAVGILIFRALVKNFLGALESGKRFSDLCSDGNHLNNGSDQKSQK